MQEISKRILAYAHASKVATFGCCLFLQHTVTKMSGMLAGNCLIFIRIAQVL